MADKNSAGCAIFCRCKARVKATLREPIKFLLVGASNTVVGLSVIYVGLFYINLVDILANFLGYLAGFLWSYWANNIWTFSNEAQGRLSVLRYAVVCIFAYSVNLLVIFALHKIVWVGTFLPHIAGMVCYTSISYIGSKHFVFSAEKQ